MMNEHGLWHLPCESGEQTELSILSNVQTRKTADDVVLTFPSLYEFLSEKKAMAGIGGQAVCMNTLETPRPSILCSVKPSMSEILFSLDKLVQAYSTTSLLKLLLSNFLCNHFLALLYFDTLHTVLLSLG